MLITNFNDSSISTSATDMTAGILNIGNLITNFKKFDVKPEIVRAGPGFNDE